jgi:hypothetical protein
MNAPVNLREGKVLLLAGPESFNAAYIRRSFEFFGVPVLAPPGPAAEAFATLSAADWTSITACVAVDLGQAQFADLSHQRRDVPFLFVGYDPSTWFPGPYAWLCPPFASYQVVEALGQMVGAATVAMYSPFNPPPTEI